MTGGEDWVMRPVLRGLCKFESLRDGSLSMMDIAFLNESLDVEEENNARAAESARRG